MTTIEKELMTMGNTTKKATQSYKEFVEGYKEFKLKKTQLLNIYHAQQADKVEA
ncbi:hypothetical protein [Planococcus sp. YIM B11945]|uniref:hypothetical protein n=1 Tax=Planococcus sp. YIM B11945 TaxID=3435410 RepID=UPI003D7D551D